jgi:hypothetical protein
MSFEDRATTERAFQKQKGVFLGDRKRIATKKVKGRRRFVREVGLGFRTPREALNGNYIDKKCPFTGNSYFTKFLLGLSFPQKKEVFFSFSPHPPETKTCVCFLGGMSILSSFSFFQKIVKLSSFALSNGDC